MGNSSSLNGPNPPEVPPFKLKGSRFDLQTFSGRLRQIETQFDPTKLLVSSAELVECDKVLDLYEKLNRAPEGVTDAQLWHMQEIRAARCHPDTGAPLFPPFSFAAYSPMQPLIVCGMCWPGGGIANQIFWQWFNQSFNAGVSYANKNASSPMSNTEIGVAYTGAVGSGIGFAVGAMKFGTWLSKSSPRLGPMVSMGAPFIGTVMAGCASVLLMRNNELTGGVTVKDDEGNAYGMSKAAARDGLGQCCLARFIWNIPIVGVTPVVQSLYDKSAFHTRNPRLRFPVMISIATSMIVLGIYPTQAYFKQTAEIAADDLEPEFQNVPHKNGKGGMVKTFYFNKGL